MTSRTGKPIVIEPYDPVWKRRFEEERAMLYAACGRGAFVRIEHVGSTSVPGLGAKPIVDIMPGVRSIDAFTPRIPAVEALGYEYVPEFERDTEAGPGMPFRRYFRKDVDCARAFHLHVVEVGGDFWRDHLVFRNWLRWHREDAIEYEALKQRLAREYNETMLAEAVNINIGYTEHKSAFIEAIKEKARARIARSTPVAIVPYNELWPVKFEREREAIASAIGGTAIDIQHVGSTSVPGLAAKPTVDIGIGVRSMEESRAAIEPLRALGYALGPEDFADWRYFDREGHAPFENIHLHMLPFGGDRWNRHLLFRDYLRARPDAADAYAMLKRALAEEFVSDRLGYVEAKGEFIENVLRRAVGAAVL